MADVHSPTTMISDVEEHLVTSVETEVHAGKNLLWNPDRNYNHWMSIDFSDTNYLLDQFKKFRDVQMKSSEYRADALDGMAVISAFLVAFACNDLMSLQGDSFDKLSLFTIYATFLMTTVTTDFFVMIVFALISVKMKRLLARDAAADIYITQRQLDAFKNDKKCASTARAWYYGMNRHGDLLSGMAPNKMVGKSIIVFLVMIGMYIGAVFVKCRIFTSTQVTKVH